MGEALTYWTIGLSLSAYLATLLWRLRSQNRGGPSPVARLTWSAGFVLCVLHVLCALATFHHFSHADAFEFSARRTADTVGLNWGGGLYVNYLFMAVWGLDATWWWIAGDQRYERRSRWIEWPIQGFMAFIVFNAAIVFARPMTRLLGLAGTLLLGASVWDAERRRKPPPQRRIGVNE